MIWIATYAVSGLVFIVLDFVWLRAATPILHRQVLGDLLAPKFRAAPAVAFYLVYTAGIVWFAVLPGLESGVHVAVVNGALLGILAYATYELTNQATLKVWSTQITLIDIAWGAAATALASGAATWLTIRFAT